MKRATLPVLLLAGGIAAAAPAPLPKPQRPYARPDLVKMQGEWVVVSEEQKWSNIIASEPSPAVRVAITGDRVRGCWLFGDGAIRLYLETGSRAIGLHFDGDTDARFVGIYRLRGETLT